jgi:hypothetical protein
MDRTLPILLLIVVTWLLLAMISPAGGAPQDKQGTPFAGDRVDAIEPIKIDTKRALGYLKEVCTIGPRMSGTPGMKKQQELLQKHFTDLGAKVRLQTFQARQFSQGKPVEMTNLIVSWNPENRRRVILCSHYDTRPIADQEKDPRKWRETFVSANDGGSGVALLMELGHHMDKLKPAVGVDFVFFDGEEYIFEPKRDKYFFGSQHFAQAWRQDAKRPTYLAAVLLDMIGGKNPRFPVEGYSWFRSQPLAAEIWQIAAQQGCKSFQQRVGDHVLDDHTSLHAVGIPAIDIIDFSYPHWHRLTDTPENCAPEGLDQVARVLTVWLQRLK